ncbi:hypothetical protein AAZX31_19G056700 [Glycine max]
MVSINIWEILCYFTRKGGRSSPPKWSAEFCGCGEDPNTCKIPAEYLDDNTIFHLNPSGGRSSPPKCSAEFCGCGEDPKTCLITCYLPCVTFGQIAEIVDEGCSNKISEIRNKKNITYNCYFTIYVVLIIYKLV